jgi:hypothetical protein
METEGTAGPKSFLIRDLLSDLIVKTTENEETSDNDDSGKKIIFDILRKLLKKLELISLLRDLF